MATVSQIMTKRVKSIGPKSSIVSAAKAMRTARLGSADRTARVGFCQKRKATRRGGHRYRHRSSGRLHREAAGKTDGREDYDHTDLFHRRQSVGR